MANHTGKGCFKKGESGNPGGRPKLPAEVKEAFQAKALMHWQCWSGAWSQMTIASLCWLLKPFSTAAVAARRKRSMLISMRTAMSATTPKSRSLARALRNGLLATHPRNQRIDEKHACWVPSTPLPAFHRGK